MFDGQNNSDLIAGTRPKELRVTCIFCKKVLFAHNTFIVLDKREYSYL